jgi:bacterioferritin
LKGDGALPLRVGHLGGVARRLGHFAILVHECSGGGQQARGRTRLGDHLRDFGLSWSVLMRGDQQVIEYLNKALRHELAAVNQYWLHYRILDNWGYKAFAKTWREESIEEMRHADKLVARILFLDGQPNMQSLDQLRIGRSVKEIIECDLAAENDARVLYLQAAQHCFAVNDRVTKNLFEAITADEEEHIDFLEAQLTLIEHLGVQLYSQKHVGDLEG